MLRKLNLIIFLGIILPCLVYADKKADTKEASSVGYVRGIYVTQDTFEQTRLLENLIRNSKKVGINTFVVDIYRLSKRYDKNMQLLRDNNIKYVARIDTFPNGGTREQVASIKIREKRYRLIERAVALGAQYIQLDYIRYNTKQPSSMQNVYNVEAVIKWFKERLDKTPTKLGIDVFGEVCSIPSLRIGQDVKVFAGTIDALSPMVYPSHYFPPLAHSNKPYETIETSLTDLKKRFDGKLPFKLYPFIEVHNFRYRYSAPKRIEYIYKQIKAVDDAGADGWYAWSPTNKYAFLFKTLELHRKDLK